MKELNATAKLFHGVTTIVVFFTFISANRIFALEPPQPGEMQQLHKSKQYQKRIMFAKQLGNDKVDQYLLKKSHNRAERKRLEIKGLNKQQIDSIAPIMAPPPAWQGLPTKGDVKIFALLIEFPDHIHSNSYDTIDAGLFGNGGNTNHFPNECLAAFYRRSSYNSLRINGNTLGWYQTSYNRSAVNQTTAGRENLIKEAIEYYDSIGHDFSQYDNNGDGKIDYFMVFWSGPHNGWANFWWGYKTGFSQTSYSIDGKQLGAYSWQWESNPVGTDFNASVAIHETGHALGLPDYYDYDNSVGPDGGVGCIDMMHSNWGDHNCFSKWLLDWVSPVYIFNGSQNISLDASGESQNCVLMWPPAVPNVFSEYFMIQNRHRVRNDTLLPADGMLIWHVDATLNSSGTNYEFNNSSTSHKLLKLIEADGNEDIENESCANEDDYFTTGATFGPCAKPFSKQYDGTSTKIKVSNFSAPGRTMSATFTHNAGCPFQWWFTAYKKTGMNKKDIKLVRKFRDEVLMKTAEGRTFKTRLYKNSDMALKVLLEHPYLFDRLAVIFKTNRNEINKAVHKEKAEIQNLDEITLFLDDFLKVSPDPLKCFLGEVKENMIRKEMQGETYLSFTLSERN